MRTVALLGNADSTLHFAHDSQAAEVWGIGGGYRKFPPERMTRIYELHPLWMLEDPAYNPGHFDWLRNEKPDSLRVVWAEDYPLREALALCENVKRGENVNHYFTSSADWMIAAALVEGFERIELYGLDMGTSTEHKYQVPGISYWMGFAAGRGAEIYIPDTCSLLRGRLYAFEPGAQMISRQKAEMKLVDHTNARDKALAQVNYLQGICEERQARFQRAKTPSVRQVQREAFELALQSLDDAKTQLYIAEGAVQAMKMLIDEFDMREPAGLKWKLTARDLTD